MKLIIHTQIGNHIFSVILWQEGQNLANVAKGESFLNINPKRVDTKFELHCMNTF